MVVYSDKTFCTSALSKISKKREGQDVCINLSQIYSSSLSVKWYRKAKKKKNTSIVPKESHKTHGVGTRVMAIFFWQCVAAWNDLMSLSGFLVGHISKSQTLSTVYTSWILFLYDVLARFPSSSWIEMVEERVQLFLIYSWLKRREGWSDNVFIVSHPPNPDEAHIWLWLENSACPHSKTVKYPENDQTTPCMMCVRGYDVRLDYAESTQLGVLRTCRQGPGQREWCGWSNSIHSVWVVMVIMSFSAVLTLVSSSVFMVKAIRIQSRARRHQQLYDKAKWLSFGACKAHRVWCMWIEYIIGHSTCVQTECVIGHTLIAFSNTCV